MTSGIFLDLTHNVALLLAAALVYDLMTSRYRPGTGPLAQVAIGAMLGFLGCLLIISPWTFGPGIIFDTRSVLLSVSGLFFGTIPIVTAMVITSAFRLYLGGAAAWTGVAVIVATGSLGIAWRHLRRWPLKEVTWFELYLFGLLVHAIMLGLMFILPWPTAIAVLSRISLPIMIIYPLATVLLGILMVNRLRRECDAADILSNQERMRLFFERQIAGMAITSPQMGWLRINDGLCRMLGYSREELAGLTWKDLTHPDDLQADLQMFDRLLAGDIDEYTMEKRFLRKDGSIIWAELSVGCVRLEDGTVDYVLTLLVDITKRKQAEDSMRLFKTLVESSSDAIGMSTPAGRHFYQNRAFTNLFGDIGEDPPSTLYVDKGVGREVFKTIMAGERWDGEVKMHGKDGKELSIFLRAYANRDSDGNIIGLVGVHTDITRQRQAAEEKEHLQAQLLQAQKMESVGRLAGGVAHDFNNMLQAILGYADLALSELKPADKLHEYLLEIRKAGVRSANLTRQLLAFARKQTVNPKVLDLNDTVASMIKMLQRLIGEDVELAWLPGRDLWRVMIDPSQIDQLLANLMVNARDAISDTGLVTLKTENVIIDADFCAAHPGIIPGEYVLLEVNDNGSGMDRTTLSHIFEPFFTTKSQDKGTGLGLATIYGIVKQNNGYIEVESEPGVGTTFSVYLPRHRTGSGGPFDNVAGKVEPRGGLETVLFVEDEQAILDLGKRILERLGYSVLAAGTPDEALRLAEAHDDEIHLLITDVVMPGMNGRELARHVSVLRPGVKCLYISGYTADVIAKHGILDENLHFVPKPFTVSELASKVREALGN